MTLRLGFVGPMPVLVVALASALACDRDDQIPSAPQESREVEAVTIDRFAASAGLRAVSCNVHACCSALLGDNPVMFYCRNGACEWVSMNSPWDRPFAC